jgi:hypothetical protein
MVDYDEKYYGYDEMPVARLPSTQSLHYGDRGCFDALLRHYNLAPDNIIMYILNTFTRPCSSQQSNWYEHLCVDTSGNVYNMLFCKCNGNKFDRIVNNLWFDETRAHVLLSHLTFLSTMDIIKGGTPKYIFHEYHGYYTFQIHNPIIKVIGLLIESFVNLNI